MTTIERPTAAPRFTAWSPVIAGAAELSASFLPGWVTALICAIGVLCALPFRRFRAVVPWALVTVAVGWLISVLVTLAEATMVGFFVV
jgi:hypothetical protein